MVKTLTSTPLAGTLLQHLSAFQAPIASWANANEGFLALLLAFAGVFAAWILGVFQWIRQRPLFRIETIEGPTLYALVPALSDGDKECSRLAISLYLEIANVGSAPATVDAIEIAWKWHGRFGLFRTFRIKRTLALQDFTRKVRVGLLGYPFLTQKSGITGESSDNYLMIGQTMTGVEYFEQYDRVWGACKPRVDAEGYSKFIVVLKDSYGKLHKHSVKAKLVTLDKAREYNESFGASHANPLFTGRPPDSMASSSGMPLPNEKPDVSEGLQYRRESSAA